MRDSPASDEPFRLSDAAAAFIQGAADMSRVTFYAMCVGFVAMGGVTAWFFSYDTLAQPTGTYLSRSSKDLHSAATHRALALGQARDERPRLLVLGTSAISNALADEAALKAAVDAETGHDWRVAMLATPLQSPLEQMSLIEAALGPPPGPKGQTLIVIGVSPLRYNWTAQQIVSAENEGRIGLRSDWADAEVRRLGGEPRMRSPIYLLENKEFVAVHGLSALIRLCCLPTAKPDFAHFAPKRPQPPEDRRRLLIGKKLLKAAHSDQTAINLLDRLAQRLAPFSSVRLVLTDSPVSPELIDVSGAAEVVAMTERKTIETARRRGLSYWPLAARVGAPSSAYYDDLHIGDPTAQQRFRETLADFVHDLRGPRYIGWLHL